MVKQVSASLAKVTRPVLTGVFPRERLFDQLDRMRERSVTWISGPPGCGKTTLVTGYLEARGYPCLWYQVDEGDADPATFFYYLGLAAKKAAPRKRKPLPLLTPEYLSGISTFTLRYFENLYNRLKSPSYLVFDNYQEVPTVSPFHEVIRHGISHIPEGINVVLISRNEPPSVLARMRANQLMEVLGWSELRLTLEETNGLAQFLTQQEQSRETILQLHTTTDGWAAGLVLILETAKRESLDPELVAKFGPEEIFDYFAGESFEKMDRAIQEFLLKTAFLPKMTASMAKELTGFANTSSVLYELNRSNYFTERLFHRPPAYQYHPLYREFLLARAKERFSPDSLLVLRQRAAVLLEDGNQIEAAIALLHENGDWEAMVQLIMKHAPSMLVQGRNRPLEEWLSSLPEEILESTPWLLYWLGACRQMFDPSSSQQYFEQAFEKFKFQENAAGIFLAWSGIVESISYAFEDFTALDRWIGVLGELVEAFRGFPSEEIKVRVASGMFSALVLRQPQHPELEAWAARALSVGEDPTTINAKMHSLFHLAYYRIYSGDLEKAAFTIDSIRHLGQSRDAGPLAQITARYAEVMYYLFRGLYEKCSEASSKGLELSRTTGVHILDHMFLGSATCAALNVNDSATAGKLLEKMAASLGRFKPWDAAFYNYVKALEALHRGDLWQASVYAESSLKFSIAVGSPFTESLSRLLKSQVMQALGEYREAAKHLGHTFRIAHQAKSESFNFSALMTEAQFALDQGNEESGLMTLRKALAIGKEGGRLNTFMDQPSVTARLCAKALEVGIEVEYVQDIIRKRNLIPDEPPLHLENWPWALKIFTLGRFELLKNGKPVRFSRKAQKRPLSMLKALIAFGGSEVQGDQIADALWPEADGDTAHQSFATTLHRLRKLVGHREAVQLRDGRLTLDPRYCWVDLWALERVVEQAQAAWSEEPTKDTVTKAVQLTQKAYQFYQGPLLAGETVDTWAISPRERLRSKFLWAVEKLGDYWEGVGKWDRALECYQKGVEVDDLAEEFYRGLMVCYHRLGRRADGLAAYNRCKKTLAATLGIKPSPETEAARKSLLSEQA